MQVVEQGFHRLHALGVDEGRVHALEGGEVERFAARALLREDVEVLLAPHDRAVGQKHVERLLAVVRGRTGMLVGRERAAHVGVEDRHGQPVLPHLHRRGLDRMVRAQPQTLGHGAVVGNARQPKEVRAVGDGRELVVADGEDDGLGQLVVPLQHLDHRERVFPVVAVDVCVVRVVARQELHGRFLPVGSAEQHDLGRLVEPGDMGVAQRSDVDVEVVDAEIAVVVEGLGDLLGEVAAVELGSEEAVQAPDRAEQHQQRRGHHDEVAHRPAPFALAHHLALEIAARIAHGGLVLRLGIGGLVERAVGSDVVRLAALQRIICGCAASGVGRKLLGHRPVPLDKPWAKGSARRSPSPYARELVPDHFQTWFTRS